MKRIILFLVTNLAVLFVLTIATNVIFALCGKSVEQVFGPQWGYYVVFAFVYGLGASMISLLLSKTMAKMSVKAKTITGEEGPTERWLVGTVADLAGRAGLKTPEVAIYEGEPNAFATGAFRNHALVAVSTGILTQMNKEELRAVLGHEMSHVSNGDMVTMGLLQGVLNAFVLLLSRVLGSVIANALSNERGGRRRGGGALQTGIVYALQFVLGILASMISMAFSRHREYAADAGSAKLLGSPMLMIAALRRLGHMEPGAMPDSLKAFGIATPKPKHASLFASHPSLEDRIAALEKLTLF